MESKLKSLWSSLLDLDQEHIQDDANFFEIGGDSVAAIKLAGLAGKEGLHLPAQTIFANPSLNQMAGAVNQHDPSDARQPAVSKSPAQLKDAWDIISASLAQCKVANEDLEDVITCPPFQAELMRASHNLGAWMFQAVFEVRTVSLERAKRTLSLIRQRTPSFRTRVVQLESGYYQVITKDPIVWDELHCSIQVAKQKELGNRMCYGDALTRYAVVHDQDKTYVLWTLNHTIYDRFSKMSTLEDVHNCFRDPESFAQSPPRPPFRSFTEHVSSLDARKGVNFWRAQLRGLNNHEVLFIDDPEREYLTSAKCDYRKTLPYQMPKGKGINFDTVAQVAWTLVMADITRSDDVFYCAFRSCRHLDVRDIQDIIGPLWSMVPVRRKISAAASLESLLIDVQKATIAAIPYEPFGIQALNQHFGHRRYLQSVILPQPPQPDFGLPTTAQDEHVEHYLRSCEELWTQTRGPYGLYIMITPKGERLDLWARYDEHFISSSRVEKIVGSYAEMLDKILKGNWGSLKIQDLCSGLKAGTTKGSRKDWTKGAVVNRENKPKTLTHLFSSLSQEDAALILPGENDLTLSHYELHQVIGRLQEKLAKLGIEKGSAVSIALPNGLELIAAFLATTWQRGIAAPLNPAYKQDEFEFYIDDLGSALVVIPQGAFEKEGPAVKAARKYQAAIAECYWDGKEVVLDVKDEGKLKGNAGQELIEAHEDDIALVLHTSGTTGRPKAVPLNHYNLMSNIANICRTYSLDEDDRTMLIMPLFHVHGLLASFLSPLFSGGSAIVPQKLDPSFWETFSKHGANWYSATPSMHKLILQFPPPDTLPDIRFIRSCSSQLSPALYHQLKDAFKTPIVESYAMTEASHLMCSNPLGEGEQKPGSVGKPQGIDMRILDSEAKEQKQGHEGEVCIKGPNVTLGYLNNPDANKSSFTDQGFFRTGDQGKFDEDGYLVLTGRLKEMVNKGGEKISPVELDNIISQHESVGEAVTFAIDDEDYGQDVGAAVVLKGDGIGERELKRWVGEKVSAFKVPKKIWFCESIPKTATGKLQRKMVAEAMQKKG